MSKTISFTTILFISCFYMPLSSAFYLPQDETSNNPQQQSESNTPMPQTAPNVVMAPSAQAQQQTNQLFNDKANYKHFHHYDKLKSFNIPVKDDNDH